VGELASTVWDQKKFVLKVTGICVFIGLIIALVSPVEYKADATLLPETPSQMSVAGGLLEEYGGLIGLGGGLNIGADGSIPPDLYPNIVESLPFQLELLNQPIRFASYDTTLSTYAYFDELHDPSVFDFIKEYTLGLPYKIMGLFSPAASSKQLPIAVGADSIIHITQYQQRIINEVRDRLTVSIDEETSLITLAISMPDSAAAAQLGRASIQLLEKYVTNYRTKKATEDLAFIREQVQEARDEFRTAQQALADFEDSNIGILTAQALTQKQRLQSTYDLKLNTYSSLAQQLEQAKLKVQANTPVVTVLEPIKMPVDNYKPRKKLIIILFFIVGFIISAGYVMSKKVLRPQS